MTPIKLEPSEGIDVHAQGLLLISREFAVNRSAPEKAKRRQKLFCPPRGPLGSQPTLFTYQYLRLFQTDDGTAGLVARVFLCLPPMPFFQLLVMGALPSFPWGVAWLFIVRGTT